MNRTTQLILFAIWLSVAGLACDSTQEPREEPKVMVNILNTQSGQTEELPRIDKTPRQWQQTLTSEQYHIAREKGTEQPFTGEYNSNKGQGIYQCAACKTDLYRSETKFDSGSGWPSFYEAVAEGNIETKVDSSLGMARTEVMCGRCSAHLGHIFNDGPQPTGMRHCINSAILEFVPTE